MKKLSLIREYHKVMATAKKNAAEEAKQGKMIALFIPQELGSQLQHMFSHIPGDEVKPEDMHITLGLLDKDSPNPRKIISLLKDLGNQIDPLDIKIGGFGSFPPNKHNQNKYVLWAKPESDQLIDLHDTIFSAFEKHGIKIDNGAFDFDPHITIKYCDEQPEIDERLNNPIFRIKHMAFASGDIRHPVMFRGK